jgi:hypothetical protein
VLRARVSFSNLYALGNTLADVNASTLVFRRIYSFKLLCKVYCPAWEDPLPETTPKPN